MKTQAMKCSTLEVHWLNYWRRHGYRIGRTDDIPCSALMPPRRRQRTLRRLAIVAGVISLAALWLV
jgi:hypothetical protein